MCACHNFIRKPMFQKIIIDKYIELNLDKIQSAYKRYVTFFHDIKQSEYLHQCKETELKSCLLHELFINVLDYKLALEHNYNFISKEKNQTDNNDSGTVVIIDNNVRIVIELKSIKTTEIKQSELCRKHFKFQQHKNIKAGLPINKHLYITENSSVNSSKIFSYGYKNLNTTYVIITNLEKLLLYVDNVVEHVEWNLFSLNEEQFALLWLCLAYENIVNDLPKKLKTETIIHQDKIIKEFYNVYKEFQNVLFIDLISQNAGLDRLMLFLCTQKILNRLLFILFADDCGLLPSGTIKEIIREWRNLDDADEYRPMYMYLQKYFSYLDNGGKGKKQNIFGYNGGLFKPIEFLDKLKISDSILVDYLIKLSSYNYRNDINVEVLGHIFENFISEIERLKYKLSGVKNYDLQVVDKRQKDVIFYPMGFVASYIIESTVGQLCMEKKSELGLCKYELLEQIDLEVKSNVKKPKKVATTAILDKLEEYRQWLLSLSVCDPACGSGTFLIAVLDFLKNEHHYIDRITAQILGHSIVFSEYELSILENNIFGVDINEECVEITKLALWLRTAKPNHKLNSLDANIKCGNSLISDPKIDSNKTFEWHKEFPNIFKNGGFNVVIGNPPYIFARMGKFSEAEKEYYYARYPLANYQLNTYLLFIDLSYRHLLRENGVLGFIVPNNCLTINMFQPFRKFLLEKVGNVRIVNISSNVFNDTNADNCIITFTKKNADTISLGEIN
ncbi:MAG: SAM-dependent methyltransferase, partial [Planctomycetaceae bacterium]|nr:SAM-dependent methyltransferase [Planctomycetaceae bacterium]